MLHLRILARNRIWIWLVRVWKLKSHSGAVWCLTGTYKLLHNLKTAYLALAYLVSNCTRRDRKNSLKVAVGYFCVTILLWKMSTGGRGEPGLSGRFVYMYRFKENIPSHDTPKATLSPSVKQDMSSWTMRTALLL